MNVCWVRRLRLQAGPQPSRIVIFFVGVFWATAIGLFVSLLLAVVPGFQPDSGAFQDRLLNFIQWYGIPITSAILLWYAIRATF